ncbi:MAG: threonylcarbamoyl-AMP synthase [Deltaproteobacteria bacterium]|nr:threonylcarbamoyl-AMP synthase [Deltaproteobacteria bacterium]
MERHHHPIDPSNPDPELLARAGQALRDGLLVAFPTETVYGLGARADQDAPVEAIYRAKGRPGRNPLIVHVAGLEEARALALAWSSEAEALARAFWPGPLTLVALGVPGTVSTKVTAGGPTVALRVPSHPVALGLVRAAGVPVAAPSANRYQHLSPTLAEHVHKSLGDRVQWILDGGPCALGLESSVVDTTTTPPTLLRPGALCLARLQSVVPALALHAPPAPSLEPSRSPGLEARHYAPSVPLRVLPGRDIHAFLRVNTDLTVGVVLCRERYECTHRAPVERLGAEPERYGAALYASLHRLEDLGCDLILVEEPPNEPAWATVTDRLRRASEPSRSGGAPP